MILILEHWEWYQFMVWEGRKYPYVTAQNTFRQHFSDTKWVSYTSVLTITTWSWCRLIG